MKVTIVVGGRWHAFDLAREVHRAGYLHKLITSYPRWFVSRWGIPKDKVVSLPLTFWVVKAIYKIGGERLMMSCQWHVHRWFADRAVKHLSGSELIHGWSQWSEPSLIWAQQRGIPTVLERSSAHILEQSRLLREEHQRLGLEWTETHSLVEKMELREYELCTKVAVPSLFVERSFRVRSFPEFKIYRNPLGVDLSCFKPERTAPPEPGVVGLRVIYAGSFSVRKGITDLVAGFQQAELTRGELTLIGGKPRELESLIGPTKGNIKVIEHMPQSELAMQYTRAHCFAMASVEDGFGMVLCQALACGLPIICSRNTGGEDLLRMQNEEPVNEGLGILRYPAGFVVPTNSPKAISWCLRKLEREIGFWPRQRQAALHLANERLDWREYGKRALMLYRDLLR